MPPKEPSRAKRKSRRKPHRNGVAPSRAELIGAHERMLKRIRKMSPKEGFALMVRAGIYTRGGKLTARYGGC